MEQEIPKSKKPEKSTGKSTLGKLWGLTKAIGINMDKKQEIEVAEEDGDPEVLEDEWDQVIEILGDSKQLEKHIDEEHSVLADAIINIGKYIDQSYIKNVDPKPDLKMIVKKCIEFIRYAVEDNSTKDTIVTLLKVLRKIIDKIDDKKKKEELQNQFDNLGAMKMVLYVLSRHSKAMDNDLLLNFLHLGTTMLEGGNKSVQKTIYEYFSNNQKSEIIFQRFEQIIRKQISNIEMQAKERRAASMIATMKVKDDMNEEDADELATSTSNDVVILENVLRFMMLSVEGHYLELQNYWQHQKLSRNNYDMINAVADLLKTYY